MANDTVEAIFISRNGISFLGNVSAPAESFIQLILETEDGQVLTDYVFSVMLGTASFTTK
jgi:hypothetical protein